MTIIKTKSQEKAQKSFNYACKQASKCRHEKYMVSCFSCAGMKTCYIQERIAQAEKKMY
jgi:hypothetical protein